MDEEDSKVINSFRGRYFFLSNFYNSPVLFDGIWFPTSEHAFQAAKCSNVAQRKSFVSISSPGEAKRKGRSVLLRDDWEDVKIDIMFEIVLFKFTWHIGLGKVLVETFPFELEEGNNWGDVFWGTVNGKGRNELGKILMKVRKML